MNAWYRRQYPDGDYARTFDLFEKIYMDQQAPKEMFMIKDPGGSQSTTVYISIPEHLKTFFPSFEAIANEDLPKQHVFLIGQGLEFERLFGGGRACVCNVCGLKAREATVSQGPTILFDEDMKAQICVESSLAPEPFKCPNLYAAAIDARIINSDDDRIRA